MLFSLRVRRIPFWRAKMAFREVQQSFVGSEFVHALVRGSGCAGSLVSRVRVACKTLEVDCSSCGEATTIMCLFLL